MALITTAFHANVLVGLGMQLTSLRRTITSSSYCHVGSGHCCIICHCRAVPGRSLQLHAAEALPPAFIHN